MTDFIPYPKTPRLFRDVVVTEKIDGSNAAVRIVPAHRPDLGDFREGDWSFVTIDGVQHGLCTQSRKRVITPEDDNFGFAKWAHDNAHDLVATLGEGVHFGEWWGSGIQRGYGLEKGEKRFSLFNVNRWESADLSGVPGLGVVPVLSRHTFNTYVVEDALHRLRTEGSLASPGFMNPEGIIVFHVAAQQVFKVLLERDEIPKGLVA